jgi:two-component system chemotaxis response regulator CheB
LDRTVHTYGKDAPTRAKIIVIGASAGGLKVIFEWSRLLPADFPIPIIVVIHRNARYETRLEENLNQQCDIQVKLAIEKDKIEPNHLYFAPAGYHLLIEPDQTFSIDLSDPVHFCRPSIDVTFESVAEVYGEHTIGILLSGANQDGAEGLAAIRRQKGFAIVQHPEWAEVPVMPQSAISIKAFDQILENPKIFAFIKRLEAYI